MMLPVVITAYIIFNRKALKSEFLAGLSFAITFVIVGNYIEFTGIGEETAKTGLMLRYIGAPFIPTFWYLCVREFCGDKVKKAVYLAAYAAIPAIIFILVATWEQNHLYFAGIKYISKDSSGNMLMRRGPAYFFDLAYQTGITLLGLCTIVMRYLRGTARFRKQAGMFSISAALPVFGFVGIIVESGGHYINLSPYILIISLMMFIISLYVSGIINKSEMIMDNALYNLYEGLLLFDINGVYMNSNQSAKDIFHQLENVPVGTHIDDMDYLPFNFDAFDPEKLREKNITEFTREEHNIVSTYNVSLSNVYNDEKVVGYSVTLINITPIKKLLSKLEEKSVTDQLTGVYNRRYLNETGPELFEQSKLNDSVFSVIMIDIDNFKDVNDNYGHLYGDYVLSTIGKLSLASFRKTDIVSRYGGEEFCIILIGVGLENAKNKAEELRAKIAAFDFAYENTRSLITVSMGVAEYCEAFNSFEDMLRVADEKLYKSKQSGRNRITA